MVEGKASEYSCMKRVQDTSKSSKRNACEGKVKLAARIWREELAGVASEEVNSLYLAAESARVFNVGGVRTATSPSGSSSSCLQGATNQRERVSQPLLAL